MLTEKLLAWLCLSLLTLIVITFSGHHRRWSLDARPILAPIQYVAGAVR
jgi:hypothetical protein